MGAAALSSNFNSASAPHLGSMMEDAEDGQASLTRKARSQSCYQHPTTRSPASLSIPELHAPRFAALAAQQEQQNDVLGPSGRPQLAPGFMFGAQQARRSPCGGMGPPINEEDVGFQFPQQQTVSQAAELFLIILISNRDRNEGGEIRGIMAEQVRILS
jgi:protein SSD1